MTDLLQKLDTLMFEIGCEGISMEDVERTARLAYATGAVFAHEGNKAATAKDLGMHRNTLQRMLKCPHCRPRPIDKPHQKLTL